eukprot:scaffold1046_cov162-Ochromonas_danica.AAC.13
MHLAAAESGGEESDDQFSRSRSRDDPQSSLTRYESHGRLIVDHEGNLDPSVLRRTSGYMYKKGGAVNARGGFRNWKRRWFVLAPVDFLGHEAYELQYFDTPNGTLKGTVSLSDVELYCDSKSAHKKVKYEFQIKLQTGGVLQLSCDDEAEREEWLDSLAMVVIYLNKVVTDSAMTLDGYDPAHEDEEVVFKLGEEVAQNCQAMGSGLFGAEAGKTASFVVQIHDLLGQKVTKGNMPMTATISNEDVLYYLTVVDQEDGSYYMQYTIATAGKYNLEVKINDEHPIFGSPFEIVILPSKTVSKECEAQGDVLQAIPYSPHPTVYTFTILAKDAYGNAKQRGGDPFEVGLMGPATLIGLEDLQDGSYRCSLQVHFMPAAKGMSSQGSKGLVSNAVMVMVTLQGKHIKGSPFKPALLEPAPTPSTPVSEVLPRVLSRVDLSPKTASGSTVGPNSREGSIRSAPSRAVEGVAPPASIASSSSPPPAAFIGGTPTNGGGGSAPSAVSVKSLSVATLQDSVTLGSNRASLATSFNQSHSTAPTGTGAAAVLSTPPPARDEARSDRLAPSSASASLPSQFAGTASAGGVDIHPMSRLERSRQRALLAKQISESAIRSPTAPANQPLMGGVMASPSVQASPSAAPPPMGGTKGSTMVINKSLNLQTLGGGAVPSVGAAAPKGSTKLELLAQRSALTLQNKQQLQQTPQQAFGSNPVSYKTLSQSQL